MNKPMWPMGRDNPNCICGDNPNVNCEVHITRLPTMAKPDKIEEILDDYESDIDNGYSKEGKKHAHSALTSLLIDSVYGFHEYIMGKNIIRPEQDQAYNYARLHKALDDYIKAELNKEAKT